MQKTIFPKDLTKNTFWAVYNNKKAFFEQVADRGVMLVGAFRNDWGELFCLYHEASGDTFRAEIKITGDALGWEGEAFDEVTGTIKDFRLSADERGVALKLTAYAKH